MTTNTDETKQRQMANEPDQSAPESADCAGENGVHIAGVTGSSPVSPTKLPEQKQWQNARSIQCPVEQENHIARVRKVFAYDADEGRLYRRATIKLAGRMRETGYMAVCLDGVTWPEHRLIWAWAYGEVLPGNVEVDHINGDRADNRLENLRKVSRLENQWNARTRADNTSGYKGVSWDKKRSRWRASISINGKVKTIGQYKTPEEARDAYKALAAVLRGPYARFA